MRRAFILLALASLILVGAPASADLWGDYVESLPAYSPPPPPSGGYPPSFSWENVDTGGTVRNYVSSVKDQRPCEICSVFAAIGALESGIMIREDIPRGSLDEPDLSEWFLAACPDGLETYQNCLPLTYDLPYLADAMDLLRSTGTVDEAWVRS